MTETLPVLYFSSKFRLGSGQVSLTFPRYSMYVIYLPTFTQKMAQMSNVGKYSIHGASGFVYQKGSKCHVSTWHLDQLRSAHDCDRSSRRHVTSMVCSFIQRCRAAVEFHEMWKPMESRWKSWWFGEKTVKTKVKNTMVCSFLMFGKSIRIAPQGFPFLGG